MIKNLKLLDKCLGFKDRYLKIGKEGYYNV